MEKSLLALHHCQNGLITISKELMKNKKWKNFTLSKNSVFSPKILGYSLAIMRYYP